MLIASKTGNITVAKLLDETPNAWTLEVEKSEVRISKGDTHERVFCKMSEALKWAGAEADLIQHAQEIESVEAAKESQRPTIQNSR
ncbi:hypothetical protein [Stutzerimonas stutzeri]|uniref:Uncharacterized protein n=1 Tax=Stutzerimonas stutzeri TaxID=316 RepID=A0AA40RV04_STUST|nr:hypothetical protein [Stutzerimonas stutzeri]MBA1305910.1 hypothetical protein [Stutzerimonas stutzeri]